MTDEERVREFLSERGVPPQIIQSGLAGLLERWERVAQTAEAGYKLGLVDYLNDLDVRQLINDTLSIANEKQRQDLAERLQRTDERMRRATEAVSFCVWGERVMRDERWSPETNWWYFIRPRKASRELRQELDELAADFLP